MGTKTDEDPYYVYFAAQLSVMDLVDGDKIILRIAAFDDAGYDMDSTTTNDPNPIPKDQGKYDNTWEEGDITVPEFHTIILPTTGIIALFAIFRRKRRNVLEPEGGDVNE